MDHEEHASPSHSYQLRPSQFESMGLNNSVPSSFFSKINKKSEKKQKKKQKKKKKKNKKSYSSDSDEENGNTSNEKKYIENIEKRHSDFDIYKNNNNNSESNLVSFVLNRSLSNRNKNVVVVSSPHGTDNNSNDNSNNNNNNNGSDNSNGIHPNNIRIRAHSAHNNRSTDNKQKNKQKNKQNSKQKNNNHNDLNSPMLGKPMARSVTPPAALGNTDFAPTRRNYTLNPSSVFETFRVRYLLILLLFLSFVGVLLYFLSPRPLNVSLDDSKTEIQSLKFLNSSCLNIATVGGIIVDNLNYLPIYMNQLKITLKFNIHSKPTNNGITTIINDDDLTSSSSLSLLSYSSDEPNYETLLSFTYSLQSTMQSERATDVEYPFSRTLNDYQVANAHIYNQFKSYVNQTCTKYKAFVVYFDTSVDYTFTKIERETQFFSRIVSHTGCPTT